MAPVLTVAEALRTIHPGGPGIPRTVVTRGPNGTLIALGIFGPRGALQWQGLWLANGEVLPLGGTAPRSVRSTTSQLTGPTALLVDLIEYAGANYTEHLVGLDERIASWPTSAASIPIAEMEATSREVAEAWRRVIRLVSLVSQLGESLGSAFPEIGPVLPEIRSEAARQEALCREIQSVLRDVILLRTSQDGNRISESAVELGRISNQITDQRARQHLQYPHARDRLPRARDRPHRGGRAHPEHDRNDPRDAERELGLGVLGGHDPRGHVRRADRDRLHAALGPEPGAGSGGLRAHQPGGDAGPSRSIARCRREHGPFRTPFTPSPVARS